MHLPHAWRREPLLIDSHLPVADAVQHMADDVRPWSPFGFKGSRSLPSTTVLVGSVTANRVKVRARGARMSSSWEPVLVGRVIPHDRGCRFEGSIGIDRVVTAFSIYWLGFVAILLAVGLAMSTSAWLSDGLTAALRGLPFVLGPVAMLVFFAGLTIVATRMAQPEREYLHAWIERVFDAR